MHIEIGLDPVLLEVGGIAILRWYSLAITLAIFAAIGVSWSEFQRKGLDTTHFGAAAAWTVILGIIGARVFHVVDDWSFYSENTGRILQVQRGGLAIWGAVAFGFIGLVISSILYKLPLLKIVDAMLPGLVLGQGIGRFGNIVNGDAWGKPAADDTWFTFTYTNPDAFIPNSLLGVPTHPYPVYDMLINFIIFGFLWWVRKKNLPDGAILGLYLLIYGVARFFVHGAFRQESEFAFGMQQAQVFSLIGAIIGAIVLVVIFARQRSSGEDTASATGTT